MITFFKKYFLFTIALVLGLYFLLSKKYKLNSFNKDNFELKCYEIKPNSWGYKVIKGRREIIIQNTIPGVGNLKGFKTKDQAEEIGELVIDKLEKGIFPPTITKDELINHQISVN